MIAHKTALDSTRGLVRGRRLARSALASIEIPVFSHLFTSSALKVWTVTQMNTMQHCQEWSRSDLLSRRARGEFLAYWRAKSFSGKWKNAGDAPPAN